MKEKVNVTIDSILSIFSVVVNNDGVKEEVKTEYPLSLYSLNSLIPIVRDKVNMMPIYKNWTLRVTLFSSPLDSSGVLLLHCNCFDGETSCFANSIY